MVRRVSPVWRIYWEVIHLDTHSLNKYLQNAYYECHSVLNTRDKMVCESRQNPQSCGVHSHMVKQELGKSGSGHKRPQSLRWETALRLAQGIMPPGQVVLELTYNPCIGVSRNRGKEKGF